MILQCVIKHSCRWFSIKPVHARSSKRSLCPSVWNVLLDSLRDPELTLDTFRRQLKTYFFTLYWMYLYVERIRDFFGVMHYTNLLFTYLLTLMGIEIANAWHFGLRLTNTAFKPALGKLYKKATSLHQNLPI